jgi:hypothetical protein
VRPYIPTSKELLFQQLVREQRARDRYEAQMQREVEASWREAREIARARRRRIAGELLDWWAPYLFAIVFLVALIWCAGP